MNLSSLQSLSDREVFDHLYRCCASTRFCNEVKNSMPFTTEKKFKAAVAEIWRSLDENDWLEAFEGHPQIGDIDSLRQKYSASKKWSAHEQSGMDGAQEDILRSLQELNLLYYEKFGFIFIVCATGKLADEMLDILQSRLPNDRETELRNAAEEQLKITLLRLEKF